MPKLPRLTARKAIALLLAHGFLLDHTTGSYYIFYHPTSGRRVTVAYHTRELPRGTIHSILRQAGIVPSDL